METSPARRAAALAAALMLFTSTATALSVLPHDVHPGFGIKKFATNDSQNNLNFRILDEEYSKFFTVLGDGLVMTTCDLSPLINKAVNLVVLEQTPNSTATHLVPLFVLDRRDILRFKADVLQAKGQVIENASPGTKVENVPILLATSIFDTTPIIYKFISGNDDNAFALQDSDTLKVMPNVTVEYANRGVWLVTGKPLDREKKDEYILRIQASDERGVKKTVAKIIVEVTDDNDNAPVFLRKYYRFKVNGTKVLDRNGNATVIWKRFTSVGKVEAKDADGDKVAFSLSAPSNLVVIVPQTGEMLLTGQPTESQVEIKVEAHDVATPSLKSISPAVVFIDFVHPADIVSEGVEMTNEIGQNDHRRKKRRVTRAVRPTKRIEFTEADGETEGRSVFQLEKETDRETFKIRDENVWVTVESSGVVKVKKKWDFEELGPEKTIDFWVTITNAGNGGKLFA